MHNQRNHNHPIILLSGVFVHSISEEPACKRNQNDAPSNSIPSLIQLRQIIAFHNQGSLKFGGRISAIKSPTIELLITSDFLDGGCIDSMFLIWLLNQYETFVVQISNGWICSFLDIL